MKSRIRRVFLQLGAWKGYYVLLALLCVISSAGGLFVAEMLRSAAVLRSLSYLPYEGYYRVGYTSNQRGAIVEDTAPYTYLQPASTYFRYFENVENILVTTVMTARTTLEQFTVNYNPSGRESSKFAYTVVPDSAYDDEFRTVKRRLVAGRHIVQEDENTAMMDVQLAELNGIGIGDTFSLTEEEQTYTVVGLFETLQFNSYVPFPVDNPLNMLFVSDNPIKGHWESHRNFYLSFKYPYEEEEAKAFLLQTMRRFSGGMVVEHTAVSVEELNRNETLGVTSMIRMSAACAMLLGGVVIVGLSLFITVLTKKRSREFQLMNALGKKKNAVIADFGAELALVILPSLGIGLYASSQLLMRYIDGMLEYFGNMVSADNVQATSTFSIKATSGISSGVSASIEPSQILMDAGLLLALFVVVVAACLLVNRHSYVRTPVMQVLAER